MKTGDPYQQGQQLAGKRVDLLFTEHFGVDPRRLSAYGAFDICLTDDVPLFVDPFHFFYSDKPEYKAQHQRLIDYLIYLRNLSGSKTPSGASLKYLYQFPEVKFNRLGFCLVGYSGRGPGPRFARALDTNLRGIFESFGQEQVTADSHLEKLCLIDEGVGRDMISDFTVNITKDFFLSYTEAFAKSHLAPNQRREFTVEKADFDFNNGIWRGKRYTLPKYEGTYVILTPEDLLTGDDTWISHADMFRRFGHVIGCIQDAELRERVNAHFTQQLSKDPRHKNTAKELEEFKRKTVRAHPEVIDHYIRYQEEHGELAIRSSKGDVERTRAFYAAMQQLIQLLSDEFYSKPAGTFEEVQERVAYFKQVIEKRDGWKLFHSAGAANWQEPDARRMFTFVWHRAQSKFNTEVDNGRGPSDAQASHGADDVTEIELKLGSNKKLEQNLQNQLKTYKDASGAERGMYVILNLSISDERRVNRILKKLKLENSEEVVVIDARRDNKPSGSRA